MDTVRNDVCRRVEMESWRVEWIRECRNGLLTLR